MNPVGTNITKGKKRSSQLHVSTHTRNVEYVDFKLFVFATKLEKKIKRSVYEPIGHNTQQAVPGYGRQLELYRNEGGSFQSHIQVHGNRFKIMTSLLKV